MSMEKTTVTGLEAAQPLTRGKPVVSIITAFLNAERFLVEAIESVLAQDYPDWELLLIDDGSADGSSGIARDYAGRYPGRVRYVEHAGHLNRGLPASRNLGLQMSLGKYIALLDADDVWLPHKLKDQVALLEDYVHAAMVYGRSFYWYSWTGDPADHSRDHTPDLGVQTNALVAAPELTLRCYPLGSAVTPCPSDILLRREALEAVGGFEDSFRGPFTLYEDQAFLGKIFLEKTVFVADQCWDRYRVHADSCVSKAAQEGNYDQARRYYLEWFEGYLRLKGFARADVWRALRRAQRPYRHPLLHRITSGGNRRPRVFAPRETMSVEGGMARESQDAVPPVGQVRFGDLRRTTPISKDWGFDRGRPVDRYYIEGFLARHAACMHGCVLEVGDNDYTRKFGGEHVTVSEVLHVREGCPQATIIADLAKGDNIPSDMFNCVILTQTLQLIYDTRAALRTVHRILKPGGVVLASFPGISQLDREEWAESWYWGFTSHSARRLFEEVFLPGNVEVRAFGNVLTSVSFLQGLASRELSAEELEFHDPAYEMLIAVKAVKVQGEGAVYKRD